MAYDELSVITTKNDIIRTDGIIPAGSIGTIVHVYAGGKAYEVEFCSPFQAVVTIEPESLV